MKDICLLRLTKGTKGLYLLLHMKDIYLLRLIIHLTTDLYLHLRMKDLYLLLPIILLTTDQCQLDLRRLLLI